MSHLDIITTSDGSHSLFNKELNETYHSQHGAIQESIHVFINKGLKYFVEKFSPVSVSIFEVGFGTGLNALLTLQEAIHSKINFNYTTIEAFPLEKSVWSQLNYGDELSLSEEFKKIHEAEWDRAIDIFPNFKLLKLKTTLQEIPADFLFQNIIFFDAFAPSKQPEMWEMKILEKVVHFLTSNGIFVTYCAKGQLKRDLKSLGMHVETLTGPPGKKEMVRGLKI
jgi:tRNA U34 5-methylaminomethyl-2-thiouridine-forming methyltransferase MnmC